MSIQGSKGNSAPEVCLFPLLYWDLVIVQMLLGQTEVDNKYVLVV